MEGLKLDVREQQYYGELFQACDSEGTGKITGPRASELFLASGLGSDVLKQITELCGAKRLGHFGRSQFYIALKLVACAQAGLPIKLDALNSGKDVPLPKFSSKGNEQVFATGDRKKSCTDQDGSGVLSDSNKANAQLSGQLPPPPASKKSHSRSLSGQYRGIVVPDSQVAVVSSQSSQFPTQSPPTSPVGQKLLLKQNTAPATVFAGGGGGGGSLTNISALATPADSSEPTAQVSDGGHVNPLIVNDVSAATRGQVNSVASSGQSQSQQGQSVLQASSSQVIQQQAVAQTASVTSSAPVLQGNTHQPGNVVHQAGPGNTQQPGPGSTQHLPGQGNMQQPGLGNTQQPGQENGNWTMFEDDESHMLIGPGLKQQYSNLEPPNFDSSSISSETESVDDVWSITDEQREYYMNQFKTMQPDLSAVITGPVAKHFFEKSKLPVLELSKIWQLSDLNRDGVLSLDEFCIAMHLVVLRRNDIELPDHLPLSLMPYSTLGSDEPFAADLPPGSTLKRLTPPSPQQNLAEWTAFSSESPESGDLHSPTHLANFEFAKPSADPDLKIVQPVPIHMLPDVRQPASDGSDRDSAVLHELGPSDRSPPLKQRSSTECQQQQHHHHESSQSESSNKYTNPVQGRPRPVTHKQNHTVPAIVRGQLPPPGAGQDGSSSSGVVERPNDISGGPAQSHAPPTPPPRPLTGRSLSMDVKSNPSQLIAPAIPPRVSPKEVHSAQKIVEAGVTSATEIQSGSTIPPAELTTQDVAQVVSAKPVVKDLIEDDDSSEQQLSSSKPALAIRQGSRDRRDIHIALRTHKERNTMLTRLNSELNQELQEVMEQRIALEIQLEHLRPFSS